jgi:hypothetical protein
MTLWVHQIIPSNGGQAVNDESVRTFLNYIKVLSYQPLGRIEENHE